MFLIAFQVVNAQLNMTLRSNLEYNDNGNDVWGYAADGREYAIVGLANSISIVDVTDPDNLVERGRIPGQNTVWRDIKTWEGFAYATNDQNGTSDGIIVMDLRALPDTVTYTHWNPDINGTTLNTCHNLYIDENGYCYLAGCNINGGGMVFVDVFSAPGNPQFVGLGDNRYSHDVFVRDNVMYSSDINNGFFSVTDVSDKQNPILMATQTTPFTFTHNAWLSDDSNTLFTTDERGNAPVASYDISDLDNITLLDQYRPSNTLDLGVVPHNVHVLNDYLVISYYTDGCKIVDAHRPDWLVEVGSYDTWPDADGGTEGNWGAYPFLPSGNILATDRRYGLFVFTPEYVRASYLSITVVDESTDDPLQNAQVSAANTLLSGLTDVVGQIRTGSATFGSIEVVTKAFGYTNDTTTVDLVSGEVADITILLTPTARFSLTAQVLSAVDGTPVPNAHIGLETPFSNDEFMTDANGMVQVDQLFEGTYNVYCCEVGLFGKRCDECQFEYC